MTQTFKVIILRLLLIVSFLLRCRFRSRKYFLKMSAIGPKIPDQHTNNDSDSDGDFMPALPPEMLAAANTNNDERFVEKEEDDEDEGKPPDDDDGDDDDSDEDVIGPLPPTAEDERRARLSTAQEFESRNKKMKDKLQGKEEKAPEREAWMTELPDLVRKNFGLVARGFRKDAGPSGEGRTEWTETPADREKRRQEAAARGRKREEAHDDDDSDEGSSKKKKKKSKRHKREKEREEKIRKEVDKYNEKKRGESLLEMHQKKMEKKKEKEKKKKGDKPAERVPFSREKDLEVNKFDDAKRNRLIKASAQLNTRFSHGATTSSFL